MTIPHSKSELIDAIQKEFQKLTAEIAKIPLEMHLERSMEGHVKGDKMSPHNLLSYLVGWNELVLRWHEKRNLGEVIDFPESGFNWNQLGLLAQKFYQDYESVTFTDLVVRLNEAKEKILSLIETHSDHELYGEYWYEQWTMGRMIQFNTSSPYSNACTRLRRWQKSIKNMGNHI